MLREEFYRRVKRDSFGNPIVKQVLGEARDFGRQVGIGFTYEGEVNETIAEAWLLDFSIAEDLIDILWRVGCRPRDEP